MCVSLHEKRTNDMRKEEKRNKKKKRKRGFVAHGILIVVWVGLGRAGLGLRKDWLAALLGSRGSP